MIFYDTSSLLSMDISDIVFPFAISGITVKELENIKSSNKKDTDIKYKARQIVRVLRDHENECRIIVPIINRYSKLLVSLGLDESNDNYILCGALDAKKEFGTIDFYSEDVLLRQIAKTYFNFNVFSISDIMQKEPYNGFKIVSLTNDEMAQFYQNQNKNSFGCMVNEYLVLKNKQGETVDLKRWTGTEHLDVYNKKIKTVHFGDKIKPKDEFQKMAIDSIMNNTLTVLSGRAGSGKSLISLFVAMHLIESGKYDRLVILSNPTKVHGATDLGFYTGSMQEKLLQNSIGNILNTKFGDRFAVDLLLTQDKIRLIPMADCRGMEIRENEILYITEAQNTTSELIKLCLSRASSGAKIIVEGDYNSQVDSYFYEGNKNGMRRLIEVLQGNELFGYVNLQNIWRSELARLVDKI